jgi:hypothetical protein
MAQTIVLPRQQQNQYLLNLQNMLFQMLMSKAGGAARAKETEATRLHQVQLAGYRPQAPLTGMQMKEGQIPQPDITIGGKGLYAPQITVETKKLPNGQTAYFLKQGPRTTGFSVTKSPKPEKPTTITLKDEFGKSAYELLYPKEGGLKVGKRLGLVSELDKPSAASDKDLLARSTTLRKEFTQGSKNFIKVRDAFRRVQASVEDPEGTGAGDLALIFNYMKILDPESVVRESEFANAEMSRALLSEKGVPQRLLQWRDKILRGSRLTPEQRKDFVDRASKLYRKQEFAHKRFRGQYQKLAKQYNVPVGQVVVDYLMENLQTGKIYEDETTGERRRFAGLDEFGEPIWEQP